MSSLLTLREPCTCTDSRCDHLLVSPLSSPAIVAPCDRGRIVSARIRRVSFCGGAGFANLFVPKGESL